MQIDRHILVRYFLKQASEEEKEAIRQWIESSEDNRQRFIRERIRFDASILVDEAAVKPAAKTASGKRFHLHPVWEWSLKVVASVLILLGIGAAFIGWEMYHYESTDAAYVETSKVDVAQKVSWEITDVYVEDNHFVKAGEVVAQIEKNDYEIKLAQAKSRYERALLNQQNARANHKAAQSKIELAKTDLARYKQLYADGAVSKHEFDNAQTNYDAVTANLDNAQQAVMSNSNRKVADAEINELKALMEQAELYLSYTKIYAPIDGTVSS